MKVISASRVCVILLSSCCRLPTRPSKMAARRDPKTLKILAASCKKARTRNIPRMLSRQRADATRAQEAICRPDSANLPLAVVMLRLKFMHNNKSPCFSARRLQQNSVCLPGTPKSARPFNWPAASSIRFYRESIAHENGRQFKFSQRAWLFVKTRLTRAKPLEAGRPLES